MSKNITVNGTTYDASYVSAPFADGSGNATFRESSELSLQSKSVTPTESQQTVTHDSGYFALDEVIVGAIPGTYVKPTATNAGGELEAGSTIAAGTYFTGAATVPSGGGLAEGQAAVHDIPNGKILSTQKVLSAITVDNEFTITMTLPDSLSGKLPDYIIMVSDSYSKGNMHLSFKYSGKVADAYNKIFGGMYWSGSAHTWNNLTAGTAYPLASVDGITLTLKGGTENVYKFAPGTVTCYVIYTSDDV